jgi:hypothetical protein
MSIMSGDHVQYGQLIKYGDHLHVSPLPPKKKLETKTTEMNMSGNLFQNN